MVLRSPALVSRGVLLLGAGLSVGAFGLLPHDGLHPLAVLASLLPLQLAALFWVLRGTKLHHPGSWPPASG